MIRYGELIQALRSYTHMDISNEISDEHYRLAIKLAIRKNRLEQQWGLSHITAVLLYIAFNAGQLHPMVMPSLVSAAQSGETLSVISITIRIS